MRRRRPARTRGAVRPPSGTGGGCACAGASAGAAPACPHQSPRGGEAVRACASSVRPCSARAPTIFLDSGAHNLFASRRSRALWIAAAHAGPRPPPPPRRRAAHFLRARRHLRRDVTSGGRGRNRARGGQRAAGPWRAPRSMSAGSRFIKCRPPIPIHAAPRCCADRSLVTLAPSNIHVSIDNILTSDFFLYYRVLFSERRSAHPDSGRGPRAGLQSRRRRRRRHHHRHRRGPLCSSSEFNCDLRYLSMECYIRQPVAKASSARRLRVSQRRSGGQQGWRGRGAMGSLGPR